MKSSMSTVYAIAAFIAGFSSFNLANAQITTTSNGTIICPSTGAAFCAGDSLSTNIIIRCPTPGGTGQAGNCNDNLDGVSPVGVKTFAPCYQSSSTAGDAACSYNGIVYPDSGGSYAIPGASGTSASGTGSSGSGTAGAPYGNKTVTGGAACGTGAVGGTGAVCGTGVVGSTGAATTSSSTTVITVGPNSTTTGNGFTVTGGPSGSTVTTVVPASGTATATWSPYLPGSDASAIGKGIVNVVAGLAGMAVVGAFALI